MSERDERDRWSEQEAGARQAVERMDRTKELEARLSELEFCRSGLGLSEPEFKITNAVIRYHDRPDGTGLRAEDGRDFTLANVLNLHGWDTKNARIEGCYLMRDESLPEGTIAIDPRPVSGWLRGR